MENCRASITPAVDDRVHEDDPTKKQDKHIKLNIKEGKGKNQPRR